MGTKSTLRVAAVQMKFAARIEGNLAKIGRAAAEAARRRADVVLLPECALTGYGYDFSALRPAEVRRGLAAMGQIAARHRINLLAGSPLFRGRKLYNGLVVFDRGGHIVYGYAKCHLTPSDERYFARGNAVALFELDGVPATTVICHERRYPELVRLAVMAGAKLLFHPNAGMDPPAVSKRKHHGRDGVVARAFENAIYYVFANSVGPQGAGKWSAGDSKIVGPDERVLAAADNQSEMVIAATLDLAKATRTYAQRGLDHPAFLADGWKRMVGAVRRRAAQAALDFDLPETGP